MSGPGLENNTIGTAAGRVAHDINHRLFLIATCLMLPDVEGALREVERCAALSESLLAYFEGDPIQLTSTNPAVFLRKFAAQLRLARDIDLRLNAPDLLPAISADPLALASVLTNLISNACDAMDGSGTLRIAAAPGMIAVSDSGPGIPAGCNERIFEPFFTTKGTGSRGLGLAHVRELMRRQDGSVTVHSDPGRGAQFTLRFRAA